MDVRTIHGLVAAALLAVGGTAWADDVVVIGNKDNAAAEVDKAFVAKAFTGETRNWPGGGVLALIDQSEDSAARTSFYGKIVGKSSSNVKAMWAQLVFSGKAVPPKVIDGDAEVKKAVAANKNAIGYISSAAVDDSVKVLVK
jgi:ABC-type phosphate transport system substrate-binding protein